jgi:cation diffusion facilitator CzcD-associated flavoprotein CzcO
MADWLESYSKIMGLKVLMKTTVIDSKWNAEKMQWTVTLETHGHGKRETRKSLI